MRRYILPMVKEEAPVDRGCPICRRESGHIHERAKREVVDIRLGRVLKWRMECGRTGTCQPEGIKAHSERSQRVRALNVLLYALGLSYRAVAAVLWSVGAPESPASVYREVRAGGEAARRLHHRWSRVWSLTNNDTERTIGLCLTMRSQLMRGFKVKEDPLRFVSLMAWLRHAGDRVPLAALLSHPVSTENSCSSHQHVI
ncbi:MAG: hypothetical protein N0A16_09290 [Blastocatellia bacterium]|nr:hypothetical protein [Blastocatellia bacterium]